MQIALVEDDEGLAYLASHVFAERGVSTVWLRSVEAAKSYDGWDDVELAVVDYNLGDGTGTDVLEWLFKTGFKGTTMISTGHSLDRLSMRALRLTDAAVVKGTPWMEVVVGMALAALPKQRT